MAYTVDKGKRGEDFAVIFLEKRNYTILKRNFHFGRNGEIDIIAEKDGVIVFVEVKLRLSNTYGDAADAVPPSKRRKLRRSAEGYLYVNNITDRECRFDVITIEIEGTKYKLTHLINAM